MIYYFGLVLILPVTVYFFFMRSASRNLGKNRKENIPKGSCVEKHLICMYVANFLYMAAEMGMTTWMVEFYMKDDMYSAEVCAKLLSAFFLCMTVGRFAGSIFVDKIGRCRSVLAASACAAACILVGGGPAVLNLGIAVSGLFCSIIFPTTTAIISTLPYGESGRVQGIYFACGGLGGMFGPGIMGAFADYVGIHWSMLLTSVLLAGVFFMILPVRKLEHNV